MENVFQMMQTIERLFEFSQKIHTVVYVAQLCVNLCLYLLIRTLLVARRSLNRHNKFLFNLMPHM